MLEARGGAGAAPRNLLRQIISFHWPSRGSKASTELPRAEGVGEGSALWHSTRFLSETQHSMRPSLVLTGHATSLPASYAVECREWRN